MDHGPSCARDARVASRHARHIGTRSLRYGAVDFGAQTEPTVVPRSFWASKQANPVGHVRIGLQEERHRLSGTVAVPRLMQNAPLPKYSQQSSLSLHFSDGATQLRTPQSVQSVPRGQRSAAEALPPSSQT